MDVCSPKDGFVMLLHVNDGESPKRNDLLVELDTDAEDRATKRLQATDDTRSVKMAQYTGPELDLLREIAQIAVDLTGQDITNTSRDLALAQKREQLGVGQAADTSQAKSNHEMADLQHKKAVAQQKQLEFAVKRHEAVNKIAQQVSAFQMKQIQDTRNRMRIAAPIDGKVTLLVGKGSFAELGSVLLRIE
jgi:multidrug efflux pump subunit AcrA (membrane-fusion protein)